MTKREMIEAMLAGKTLTNGNGDEAYFIDSAHHPFRFMKCGLDRSERASLEGRWDFNWRIKGPSTKTRPMTRDEVLGFLANTQGVVCRLQNDVWVLPGDFKFDYSRKEDYEYATITPEGVIGEAHKFEKEVEA